MSFALSIIGDDYAVPYDTQFDGEPIVVLDNHNLGYFRYEMMEGDDYSYKITIDKEALGAHALQYGGYGSAPSQTFVGFGDLRIGDFYIPDFLFSDEDGITVGTAGNGFEFGRFRYDENIIPNESSGYHINPVDNSITLDFTTYEDFHLSEGDVFSISFYVQLQIDVILSTDGVESIHDYQTLGFHSGLIHIYDNDLWGTQELQDAYVERLNQFHFLSEIDKSRADLFKEVYALEAVLTDRQSEFTEAHLDFWKETFQSIATVALSSLGPVSGFGARLGTELVSEALDVAQEVRSGDFDGLSLVQSAADVAGSLILPEIASYTGQQALRTWSVIGDIGQVFDQINAVRNLDSAADLRATALDAFQDKIGDLKDFVAAGTDDRANLTETSNLYKFFAYYMEGKGRGFHDPQQFGSSDEESSTIINARPVFIDDEYAGDWHIESVVSFEDPVSGDLSISTEKSNTIVGNDLDSEIGGADLDDFIYGGGGDDTLRGFDGYDTIEGSFGADFIDGGLGEDYMVGGTENDIYAVDNIGDRVVEFADEGADTIYTTISYDVPVNVEVLILSGNYDIDSTGTDARDIIQGNAGNNIINGGGGFDVMQGGDGNDTYAVDNSLDAVIEAAGEGFDNVYSSVDYIIDENQEIESAILTGNAVVLRGSSSDNQLFGNAQVNVIDGRGGTDYMLGLGGADIFQINLEPGAVDVVGDFSKAEGDRMAFTGFNQATTFVNQASATSFEVRDTKGTQTLADDTVQTFILNDSYGSGTYTQGALEFNVDYYFG